MVISPSNARLAYATLTNRVGIANKADSTDGELIKYRWDDPNVVPANMSVEVAELFTRELTRSLITQSMYDKQLDSGKGTLLHLCDDVIQQEVKEVIISFFILMEQGKATLEDLDLQCEELIKEEFGASCNFDVDDAVHKLEKMGIVARDSIGRYYCVGLKRANEIIGTTTEEMVLKASQEHGGS